MAEFAFNQRQGNFYSVDSSASSRNLASPRTIEEILRQKYSNPSSVSKENSFSMSMSSPAAQLEHVLANSRFTKRQPEPSSTPRFQPRQVEVSIKDLEKRLQNRQDRSHSRERLTRNTQEELRERKGSKEVKEFREFREQRENRNLREKDFKDLREKEFRDFREKDFRDLREKEFRDIKEDKQRNVTKQSLELIQRLREEVRNRSDFLEPEEPPDLLEMNVIERGAYWLQSRRLKIEEQRQAKKDKELDGCTFRPNLNTPRMRTPSSVRSKSPNSSYSQQYVRRKNYRSLSTGKLTSRFTPKDLRREEVQMSNFSASHLSPTNKNFAYQAGINLNSFLMRAQPVVDYRYFNK